MLKAKWVYTELPISLKELSHLLAERKYSDISGSGFLLSTSTESKLTGKYIERVIQKTIVTDPFGDTIEAESVGYYICQFNWVADSDFMLVIEPPRSLRKFINSLHDLTGLGLVISEANINLAEWVSQIEQKADEFSMKRISTSGIKSSEYSTAKLSIAGTKDVRHALSEMLANKRYLIDSIRFEAEFDGLGVKSELTKSGACKLISANTSTILTTLRESLQLSTRL